ncbi:MAG: YwbE family protein [Thaumarchaeota archaeon]|nr:YwbE family protein [Nitrososphaerota archaeon]
MSSANLRKNILIGSRVKVIKKQHQKTGELTEGIVRKVLTNSAEHPHGIKVMLENGVVGRVKVIMGPNPEDKNQK